MTTMITSGEWADECVRIFRRHGHGRWEVDASCPDMVDVTLVIDRSERVKMIDGWGLSRYLRDLCATWADPASMEFGIEDFIRRSTGVKLSREEALAVFDFLKFVTNGFPDAHARLLDRYTLARSIARDHWITRVRFDFNTLLNELCVHVRDDMRGEGGRCREDLFRIDPLPDGIEGLAELIGA
jgi:hypothetical protein